MEMKADRYRFLVETFDSERLKTLSVWSMFEDGDMDIRPRPDDRRGRTPREQMIHQFVSEDGWFVKMLGIDVGAPPAPTTAPRGTFLERYAAESAARVAALGERADEWWAEEVAFFDVRHSRAWVVVRRIAHTAHHRGQLTAMLRVWGRALHSTYGPTADTGGLPIHAAPTIYAYDSVEGLLSGEGAGGAKTPLPGAGGQAPTELGSASRAC